VNPGRWGTAVACTALLAVAAAAQRGGFNNEARGGRGCPGFNRGNVAYDGRFTFARIAYGGFGGRGNNGWAHDYPTAECHFTRLVSKLTSLRVRTNESNILTLDDPELMKYPIAYMSEPGYWYPSPGEVRGMRDYLVKGGFVIFDDFEGNHLINLIRQMRAVIPGAEFFKLDTDHPIFDVFYRVKSLEYYHPMEGTPSTFYGVFEDNDPTRRMLAIANHNNDIGDYWEWSDTGLYGIDPSNEAYKLGINYLVYALTK
jgi:hypothetical protein